MRYWLLLVACCLLASVVEPRTISKDVKATKRQCVTGTCSPDCLCTPSTEETPDEEDDDEPKRLVVYYNFEKVNHNKRISDKSGYENSGMMTPGGEILRYSDKDYTCNQAGRLWESFISLRADTFQAKPKTAITIAAWIKLEEKSGMHSIFDTCGAECPHNHGVFLFQVNDGVVRWYHKDERQATVFESMAHAVSKGRWTHIAGTYDYKTKQAKIFINGEIRNQSIGDGQLSRDWGAKAEIGQGGLRALRGSIDEFRIYNYALKPDEIKALVSACKAGAPDESGAPVEGSNGAEAPAPAVETSGTARSLSSVDKPQDTSDGSTGSDAKGDEKSDNKAVL